MNQRETRAVLNISFYIHEIFPEKLERPQIKRAVYNNL